MLITAHMFYVICWCGTFCLEWVKKTLNLQPFQRHLMCSWEVKRSRNCQLRKQELKPRRSYSMTGGWLSWTPAGLSSIRSWWSREVHNSGRSYGFKYINTIVNEKYYLWSCQWPFSYACIERGNLKQYESYRYDGGGSHYCTRSCSTPIWKLLVW